MQMIKYIALIIVFGISTYIGIAFSKRYSNRVNELKEMKSILNILSSQIKFTCEPLPNILGKIGDKFKTNIGNIFRNTYENLENISAGEAWNKAVEECNTYLNKEDKKVLKNLGNMLGKVDVDSQINEINLVNSFLDMQIDKAEQEKKKNEKLYKTLGITIGMTVVIILL